MKTKAKIKWMLDVLMTIALFFLMGYQFWGESAHEWIGAGMFVLFIAHQVCNLNWYKSLFRGRYTPMRILQCVINVLTLAAMLALMYSGITMSRYVFTFLPIRGGMAFSRRLHILGSYWGYLLMSLHLGLHWRTVLNIFGKRRVLQQIYQKAGFIISLPIVVYGIYVFIKRDFTTYLFLRSEFVFLDYNESKLLFLLDYLALMGVCILMAHYGVKLLIKRGTKRKVTDGLCGNSFPYDC